MKATWLTAGATEKIDARLYSALIALAFLLRLAIVVLPGSSIAAPWSGGGDMEAYVLLARNLVSGYGYSYAHVPSAFRTPGYPLFLAAMIEGFGRHFAIAARFFQVLAGLAAAYFCMRAARILFDEGSARIALLAALFFPTLLYFSGEILTELFAAAFVALFLWALAEDTVHPRWATAAAVGLVVGLGAYFRPNVAALGLVGAAAAWVARPSYRTRLQVALIPLCAVLAMAPWAIRNHAVFGEFLFTTSSGTHALNGALNPEARTLPGANERSIEIVGFVLPNELETNDPSRLRLGSEVDLNSRCWQATRQIWASMGWRIIPWALVKWETFWLSTDQLFHPGRISTVNRIAHTAAVIFYWFLLLLAACGWWNLRKTRPREAAILMGYAILMTLLHTPFVMNSRIRAPMLDPLTAMLAGGAFTRQREERH